MDKPQNISHVLFILFIFNKNTKIYLKCISRGDTVVNLVHHIMEASTDLEWDEQGKKKN